MTFGQQAAQSCHGLTEFSKNHSLVYNEWHLNSNYICILQVKNEEELHALLQKALQSEVKISFFREPDFKNSITSVVLEPGNKSKKLCAKLKLAFK